MQINFVFSRAWRPIGADGGSWGDVLPAGQPGHSRKHKDDAFNVDGLNDQDQNFDNDDQDQNLFSADQVFPAVWLSRGLLESAVEEADLKVCRFYNTMCVSHIFTQPCCPDSGQHATKYICKTLSFQILG